MSQPMRVLHFYKTYFPDSVGGVEQVIRQMCVGTGRLGITNQVLSLSRDRRLEPFDYEGHTVHRVPLNFELASNAVSVQAIGKLARMAAEADVVHYHFPWPFMDMAHFLARIDEPTVVTYHSDIVRQKALLKLYQPLKHRFLESVDTIVATSPNYLASSAVLDRYRDKTRVITFGLDKSSYPEPDQARLDHWRARVGPKFFLFVGAVDDHDKAALLKLCYAVAFPSHLRSEAFGISLLEGAMYGKPMISSEIGTGTTYINVHGETGLVVPPSDHEALRAAMTRLWNDPRMAQEMGQRAEARYWQLFTSAQMADNYARLYQELVARRAEVRLAAAPRLG